MISIAKSTKRDKVNWYKYAGNEDYAHIPQEHKGGDCFMDAYEYIFRESVIGSRNNLILVHAIIQPLMGSLAGVKFGHSWVEDGDKVIDTSRNNEVMDKQNYYLMAGLYNMPTQENFRDGFTDQLIKEEKIKRYSVEDAKRMANEHGYYGPWDEGFSDYVLDKD
jgi:hypothetical protein